MATPRAGVGPSSKEADSAAQPDLFGEPPATGKLAAVQPAAAAPELSRLARRLPENLKLGTSSWSFAGWGGIVFADQYSPTVLARYGLAAYAQHPLLTGVGLDRTFYAPVPAEDLAKYSAVVPDGFRFVAKAYSGLTTDPQVARTPAANDGEPEFLDARLATRVVIDPMTQAFGAKLDAVLFQFSPLGSAYIRSPNLFVDRLGEFLKALPRGPTYAVELRDPQILGVRYEEMLAAAGAVHCPSVHPRMPPVDKQLRAPQKGPLVIRWMLHPTQDYEGAALRYAPFNRLVDPDLPNRARIVKLIRAALEARRDVHLVAANKAEGSAPLTIVEVAKAVAASLEVGTSTGLAP